MNTNFDKVFIISELHPQHGGSIDDTKTMILQSKMAGANAVKVQLYDTLKTHGDNNRLYLQLDFDEFSEIKKYCDILGIELFASVFNEDRIQWCEDLNIKKYKIASRSVADKNLCSAIFETKKTVYLSLGMFNWKDKGLPYKDKKPIYFDCVSSYPTLLSDLQMINFERSEVKGFSDHTIGIGASIFAVSRGANIIEKHFTLNKSNQVALQKAHLCSMDYDDLKQLRLICDTISQINFKS